MKHFKTLAVCGLLLLCTALTTHAQNGPKDDPSNARGTLTVRGYRINLLPGVLFCAKGDPVCAVYEISGEGDFEIHAGRIGSPGTPATALPGGLIATEELHNGIPCTKIENPAQLKCR